MSIITQKIRACWSTIALVLSTKRSDNSHSRRNLNALFTSISGITFRLVDALLKLIIIPFSIRMMGVERYGIWLTANSIMSLLIISDFGIGSGLINVIGKALAADDLAAVRSFTATAYLVFGALAMSLLLLTYKLANMSFLPRWLGLSIGSPLTAESRALFMIMGCLVGCAAFLNVINFFTSALQEGYLSHVAQISASVAVLTCIVMMRSANLVKFALVTWLPLIVAYALLTVYIFTHRQRSLAPVLTGVRAFHFQTIWKDSSPLLVAQIADTVIAFASNVLIASRLGARVVPVVSVSLQFMMICSFVSCMFILPLWPAYVEANERNDWEWIWSAFRRGLLRSMGLVSCLVSIYALIYRIFIHTWSSLLPIPSQGFVCLMGAWFFVYVWNKNAMVLLNAIGRSSVRAWVAPISAVTFVLCGFLLLRRLDVLAIPVAGLISALFETCVTTSMTVLLYQRQMSSLQQMESANAFSYLSDHTHNPKSAEMGDGA